MITLNENDADTILKYLREQLEEENERFSNAKSISDKIKEEKGQHPFMEILNDVGKKVTGKSMSEIVEEGHNVLVGRLTAMIDVLTCGSVL